MSGILWQAMTQQGMARSRAEVQRMVKARSIRLTHAAGMKILADCDDLELPGKTRIRTGKHMFRCIPRLNGSGYDQIRCWGEIPVTEPESADGCIHVKASEIEDVCPNS